MSRPLALSVITLMGLVLLASPTRAVAAPVPTITLSADVAEQSSAGRFEVLEDQHGELTVEMLRDGAAAERWHLVSEANPNLGFKDYVYWGRFRLENPLTEKADRVMVFHYPPLDRIELFLEQPGGGFERHVAGDLLAYSAREYKYHLHAFELSSAPGQARWVYFRVQSTSSMQLGFDVMTPARMTMSGTNQLFLHGAYYGLMLALALYNFFLFMAIRSRAYFWYVVYAIIFTLTQMGIDGMAGRYLLPEHPGAANTFTPLMIAGLLAPPLLFAREFLDTRRHLPRLHRAVTVIIYLAAIPIALALFGPYGLAVRVAALLATLTSVLCAVLGVLVWRKGHRPARFYVIAWSSVIIGTILQILVSFGLLPPNFFFANIQRIGGAIEVVLLSLALGDHIASINAERDHAKAEAVAMERDLALTGAVQQLFLPKQDSFHSPLLSLRGFYAPAARCGGDWWWYEPLSEGRVQVLLGDVTGHGAGAAMVTAGVAAAYRALPETARHGDVRVVVEALNASIVSICGGAHHMTLAALEIDPIRGIARFMSAGAPAALVMRKNGSIEHLAAAGRPLGEPELVIGQAELSIGPGDRVFVFSDGLPEMAHANGRQLGYRGVSRLLHETLGRPNDEARTLLSASLRAVGENRPQLDDIAFVIIDLEERQLERQAA